MDRPQPTPGQSQPHYAFLLAWPFDRIGGVNHVLQNLLQEFQQAGQLLPIAIEACGEPGNSHPSNPSQHPYPTIQTGAMPAWNARKPWRSLVSFGWRVPRVLRKFHSLCRRYSISVLNPHFIGIEYLPLVLLRKLGLFNGKLILSFHGADIRAMLQTRGIERRLLRILLRGADILVSCSNGLREEILLFVPECAERTVVVPNGIDGPRFLALASDPFVLPSQFADRKIVLNIGAYEYKKGHDILLRAFAQVKLAHPDAALAIAGQRSSADVARLAAQLGIQNDVLLFEDLTHRQVASLLQRADLFAFSSRWEKGVCGEGFAMALLEAASAGKPVVSTASCGVAELISDGETGRIVPTDNPPALAAAISSLLADPDSASRMAKRLQSLVDKEFTWSHGYQQYLRLATKPPSSLAR